jgi:hypothetical protein
VAAQEEWTLGVASFVQYAINLVATHNQGHRGKWVGQSETGTWLRSSSAWSNARSTTQADLRAADTVPRATRCACSSRVLWHAGTPRATGAALVEDKWARGAGEHAQASDDAAGDVHEALQGRGRRSAKERRRTTCNDSERTGNGKNSEVAKHQGAAGLPTRETCRLPREPNMNDDVSSHHQSTGRTDHVRSPREKRPMKTRAVHGHVSEGAPALPRLLTPDQVAEWLGTTRNAVYARLERGQLARQAVVRIGRRLYFRGDALLAWLEQQGRVP